MIFTKSFVSIPDKTGNVLDRKVQSIALEVNLIDHGREDRRQKSQSYLTIGLQKKKILNKNW